jgi:hypothetical protein
MGSDRISSFSIGRPAMQLARRPCECGLMWPRIPRCRKKGGASLTFRLHATAPLVGATPRRKPVCSPISTELRKWGRCQVTIQGRLNRGQRRFTAAQPIRPSVSGLPSSFENVTGLESVETFKTNREALHRPAFSSNQGETRGDSI